MEETVLRMTESPAAGWTQGSSWKAWKNGVIEKRPVKAHLKGVREW